jgi:hypothetical protein
MGRNPVGILRQIQGKPNGEYLHPNIVGNEQVVQAVSLVDVTTATALLELHAAGGHHS